MSEGYASPDAHAYVDSSLNGADRAAFEAAMRRDGRLRARVEAWEAQNEAIRLAFGGAPRPRPVAAAVRPPRDHDARSAPTRADVAPPRERAAAPAASRAPGRAMLLALGAVSLLAGLLASPGGPADPRAALAARIDGALRATFDAPLDLASSDPTAIADWLAARFARLRDAGLTPPRLAPLGWSLIGARATPGLAGPAALLVYEDALGDHAGLLIEPTDALPDRPPLGHRGVDATTVAAVSGAVAYAASGPNRPGVAALLPFHDAPAAYPPP